MSESSPSGSLEETNATRRKRCGACVSAVERRGRTRIVEEQLGRGDEEDGGERRGTKPREPTSPYPASRPAKRASWTRRCPLERRRIREAADGGAFGRPRVRHRGRTRRPPSGRSHRPLSHSSRSASEPVRRRVLRRTFSGDGAGVVAALGPGGGGARTSPVATHDGEPATTRSSHVSIRGRATAPPETAPRPRRSRPDVPRAPRDPPPAGRPTRREPRRLRRGRSPPSGVPPGSNLEPPCGWARAAVSGSGVRPGARSRRAAILPPPRRHGEGDASVAVETRRRRRGAGRTSRTRSISRSAAPAARRRARRARRNRGERPARRARGGAHLRPGRAGPAGPAGPAPAPAVKLTGSGARRMAAHWRRGAAAGFHLGPRGRRVRSRRTAATRPRGARWRAARGSRGSPLVTQRERALARARGDAGRDASRSALRGRGAGGPAPSPRSSSRVSTAATSSASAARSSTAAARSGTTFSRATVPPSPSTASSRSPSPNPSPSARTTSTRSP